MWLLVGRGGSRGVPRKNLRVIGGRSLIARKIAGASPAMRVGDRLVCSTEDPEIAAEAMSQCSEWIKRPAELATDTAASADVVWHAMQNVGEKYDAVCLLEPSAPLTKTDTYLQALEILSEKKADAVISMKEVASPEFIDVMRSDGLMGNLAARIARMQRSRRQDVPVAWTPSAGCYLFRWEMFERSRSIYGSDNTYGVLQEWPWCIEIDTPVDLAMAEFAVEKGLV